MELDDLKAAWAELDNRLKKNEELKESIILGMMRSKAEKTVNRFIAWEMFSVIVLPLIIPYCLFRFDSIGGKNWVLDALIFFMIVIGFVYPFWGVYKLHGLMKFDISKNVGNNILSMNRYRIQLSREKKILTYFVVPILGILVISLYVTMKVKLPLWTLLICVFVSVGLICYWSYNYYNKSIDSILKSLDEIRELKEEE
jgi:predicted Kef-type K+ transport protein